MKITFSLVGKLTLGILLLSALALTFSRGASAAPQNGGIITVNSNADNTIYDSGLTLREAILISNGGTGLAGLNRGLDEGEKNQLQGCNLTTPPAPYYIVGGCGGGVLDTIKFNLVGCPCGINVYSWLPTITDFVTIDGYTNPGAAVNTAKHGTNAKIMVRLYGLNAGDGVNGLYITSGDTVVKGLDISAFQGQGIIIGSNGGNDIEGNFIHENAAGGIYVASTNNEIGTSTLASRNAIYQNGGHGIQLAVNAAYTYIYNNMIGISPTTGNTSTGNLYTGIAINSSHNYVYGNEIAYNHNSGVVVTSGTSTKVWVNSIHNNSQFGLDLGNNGISLNDTLQKDSDAGANDMQNFPSIKSANHLTKTLTGKLVSTPNQSFTLNFYKSPSCDGDGYGEGQTFLGSKTVFTNAKGVAKFTVVVKKFKAGDAITATADNQNSSTSEFSLCRAAQ